MTGFELYTLINRTVEIIIWPVLALTIAVIFRAHIVRLLERFQNVEGSVGRFSFKVSLERYMHDAVKKAVALEREGKSQQAEAVVKEATSFAAEMHGLTTADVRYLIELSEGKPPSSRWGKIPLVRAGLVEIDGGKLTEHGKSFVENYLKSSGTQSTSSK
jgi:hypothetical protein